MTAPAQPKAQTANAARWSYEGEVKEIPAARGYDLWARYRQAATALHAAKEAAKQIEQEIMEELAGFEHGAVEGRQLFHHPFVDTTSFDAKSFKEASPEHLALYRAFLVTKTTRRFKAEGTVGVE